MPRLAKRNQTWFILLLSPLVAQIAASLLIPRGEALTITSDVIQGLLLVIATAAFLPCVSQSRSSFHTRLFWILMGTGMLLWLAYQGMWNYFEVIKRQEVPDPFLGDIVLFLHPVPMIGALAVLPHLRATERDERVRMLDFALLLTWWIFFYLYFVVPWQTVEVDELAYSTNFNFAYLTEKLVLLISLAGLAYTARGGWRQLYAQLLGASALYASSSYVANWAIGHKIFYSGSILDVPWTASIAWMGLVPVLAGRLDVVDARQSKPLVGVWVTRASTLVLFSLPWAALRAESDPALPPTVRTFRITVSLLAMVVMGTMVFWRQRLLAGELTYFLDQSSRSLDELKAVQEKLIQSEKMASLGQLVGGAAHEINNPLTAMLGYSELLSAENLPSEERQLASQIGEQVRRTKTLVASLLTFARQTPAKLSPIDINSVLQTSLRLLSPQLELQAVAVRLDPGTGLPSVLADSNQLIHVCLHLAGQVGANIDPENHYALVIRSRQNDHFVVVDFFADAPSATSLPFDSQLSSEGANRPATLSLSACCRIVEEHGGRILQSSKPKAPAFRLELPATARTSSQNNWATARSGS